MESKEVVTRKEHICTVCSDTIEKGEEAIYHEGRTPTYDSEGMQDGIEYMRFWMHSYDCHAPEECKNGNHEWEKEMVLDHYVGCHKVGAPTGNEICVNCGAIKDND